MSVSIFVSIVTENVNVMMMPIITFRRRVRHLMVHTFPTSPHGVERRGVPQGDGTPLKINHTILGVVFRQ